MIIIKFQSIKTWIFNHEGLPPLMAVLMFRQAHLKSMEILKSKLNFKVTALPLKVTDFDSAKNIQSGHFTVDSLLLRFPSIKQTIVSL
ncbi:MAG: hypothetical protein AN484_27960 [Aphanizomenon flos-aquae WA102]|uniref:Uncharacterized protein n=1 Tax=Aphanizomenon flos-aquae WA102 TaxID=1710896 RepID=A0A1B7W606_APHFL|nr:MAG: hypothetical protein AN484_27960 [Aphanizomenon flos-aquae WA102]